MFNWSTSQLTHELLDFSQFGTELDELSQKRLVRGALAVEILKQPQFTTYSFVDQALMLFLLKENFLDKIELRHANQFVTQFVSYVNSVYTDVYDEILTSKDMSGEVLQKLATIAREFSKLFVPAEIKVSKSWIYQKTDSIFIRNTLFKVWEILPIEYTLHIIYISYAINVPVAQLDRATDF